MVHPCVMHQLMKLILIQNRLELLNMSLKAMGSILEEAMGALMEEAVGVMVEEVMGAIV